MENNTTIKEYILRITGSVSLPELLKVDHDFVIGLTVNVFSAEKRSNQDGTYSILFKAKPTGQIVIEGDKGEKIFAKAKGESWSKKWRNIIWSENEDYDEIMKKMVSHWEEVLEFIKNL